MKRVLCISALVLSGCANDNSFEITKKSLTEVATAIDLSGMGGSSPVEAINDGAPSSPPVAGSPAPESSVAPDGGIVESPSPAASDNPPIAANSPSEDPTPAPSSAPPVVNNNSSHESEREIVSSSPAPVPVVDPSPSNDRVPASNNDVSGPSSGSSSPVSISSIACETDKKNNVKKVNVCQVNIGNTHTICVSINAVGAMGFSLLGSKLVKGDTNNYLGVCRNEHKKCDRDDDKDKKDKDDDDRDDHGDHNDRDDHDRD